MSLRLRDPSPRPPAPQPPSPAQEAGEVGGGRGEAGGEAPVGRAGGELASGSPSSSLSSRGWRSHGDPAVPLFTCHSVPQTSPPAPSPEPWSPPATPAPGGAGDALEHCGPGAARSRQCAVGVFHASHPHPQPRSHTLPRSALPPGPARTPQTPGPPAGLTAPPRAPQGSASTTRFQSH